MNKKTKVIVADNLAKITKLTRDCDIKLINHSLERLYDAYYYNAPNATIHGCSSELHLHVFQCRTSFFKKRLEEILNCILIISDTCKNA